MSELTHPGAEYQKALEALRNEQLEIEEKTRLRVLTEGHFHEWFHGNEDLLQDRLRSFLQDKENKNMGERFAMAISSDYLDVIRLIELGTGDAPFQRGLLDEFKHEYTDLKNWLINNEIIEDEMSREQSGRSVRLYDSDLTQSRVVVIRNRPLISGVIMTTDSTGRAVPAQFDIVKRMVFSMPKDLQAALMIKYEKDFCLDQEGVMTILGEDTLRTIESCIDTPQRYDLDAIRTSYYLTVRSLSETTAD